MKNLATLILLLFSFTTNAQIAPNDNTSFNKDVKTWFNAWELLAKETYYVNKITAVQLVLFDEKYVYTTSTITGANGKIIDGPKLLGHSFVWFKKAHNGELIMPDSSKSEVKIMSYTKPLYSKEDTITFFVMPLSSYWKVKDIGDHGIGYDRLALIVFLHEFTHAQQIIKGHSGMDEIIGNYLSKYPKEESIFGDDMMQDLFEKDSVYVHAFEKEMNLFYEACEQKNTIKQRKLTYEAIKLLEQRQASILKKDIAVIDNYWLTLEGLGQYSTYAWLTNPKGGNYNYKKALKILKTKWWSQEEGFPICYLLAKMSGTKNWWKTMFCRNPTSTIRMLNKVLEAK
jgi:hypothetical protein